MSSILRNIKRCKELYALVKEDADGKESICHVQSDTISNQALATSTKYEIFKLLKVQPNYIEDIKKTHRIKLVKFSSRKLIQYY